MEKLKKITLLIISFLSLNCAIAVECTAIATGDWSNPATWSCGAVPGCGDLIIIPVGFTVTVDININLDESSGCFSSTFILVNGNLQMGNGKKMNFAAGSSVQIMPGGNLFKGPGEGSSNEINITGATSWIAGDGSKPGYFLIGAPFGLPVEFVEFNVEQNDSEMSLSWIVNSENNNDYFQIDFSSDGLKWDYLYFVESIGDHSDQYTYELKKDRLKVKSDLVYIRLSQTDNDGTKAVLSIKTLVSENSKTIIYPNPAKSHEAVHFNFTSEKMSESELRIYNFQGQLIENKMISINEGFNTLIIETEQLIKGVYFVKINESEMERLIID